MRMTVVPLHKPPSRAQAQNLIRRFASEGKIAFHPHCHSRKKKRKITSVQILNCLQKGYVDEDPYLSPGHDGWETAVTGSVAGEQLRVVVCLRWSKDVLVITCYYQ